MSVRVLVVLGFVFSLALPRCTCLPPLLEGSEEEQTQGQAAIDGPGSASGNPTGPRTSNVGVTTAGGSIASPNYRMELSVGRPTQGDK